MKDFRCHNCNHLLYKAEGDIEVEVICPKCRRINYPSREDQCIGLRGKDFQARAVAHVCCNCTRLLLLSIGIGKIEIKCGACHWLNSYDTEAMRGPKYKHPWTEKGKKIKKMLAN
jgi:phage FluMu protein Com